MTRLQRAAFIFGNALLGGAGTLLFLDLCLGYEQFRTAWTLLSPVGFFVTWSSERSWQWFENGESEPARD